MKRRLHQMELSILLLIFLSQQVGVNTKRSVMIREAGQEEKEGRVVREGKEGPTFDTSVPDNLTGLVGKTAYLNCRVKNLGNRTVSWVRHKDIHLLTVGRYTYTSDQRFESVHSPHTEDWTLRIRYPQREDSGTYECQISTTPPIGHPVHLSIVGGTPLHASRASPLPPANSACVLVVIWLPLANVSVTIATPESIVLKWEPLSEILGGPEMFINIGSTINLTCEVSFSPEPPPSVLWRHNRKLINFENSRGGISLVTEKGAVTRSRLLIQKADRADNGVYSCDPTTAAAATIHVHILNGEHPAAMHHGHGSSLLGPPVLVAFLLTLLTNLFVNGLVL